MPQSINNLFKTKKIFRFSFKRYSVLLFPVLIFILFKTYWPESYYFKVSEIGNSREILPGLALPEIDRKYLWDIEHHASILRVYGFEQIKSALLSNQEEDFKDIFSSDFLAYIPQNDRQLYPNLTYAQVSKSNDEISSMEKVNKDDFTSWFISKYNTFTRAPGIKIRLVDLSPKNRDNYDEEWKGSIKLRIWGLAENQKPLELFFKIDIELDRPTEESIEKGAWVHSFAIKSLNISQSNEFLMKNVSFESGIDIESLHDNWDFGPNRTIMNTGGVYIFDFNRDGILDMLINDFNHYQGYILYRGLARGGFRDVTLKMGLPPLSSPSLVAIADLNDDGWEDLIIGPGLIFQNKQGSQFENVSSLSNLSGLADLHRTQHFSSIAIADYDKDGLVDLYIYRSSPKPSGGSWIEGKMEENYEAQLLRNTGNWKFEDVTNRANADGEKRSIFSSVWLDADNNGWPDLYLIHEFGNGVLLVNTGNGSFKKRLIVKTPSDFGSMGLTSGDIDNDGLIDLYVASMYSGAGARVIGNLPDDAYPKDVMVELQRMVAGSQLYRNTGDLNFSPNGEEFDLTEVGWAYGPAMVDLNNDGWLDIYATSGFVSRSRLEPDG